MLNVEGRHHITVIEGIPPQGWHRTTAPGKKNPCLEKQMLGSIRVALGIVRWRRWGNTLNWLRVLHIDLPS
jgi:hypothetical protein